MDVDDDDDDDDVAVNFLVVGLVVVVVVVVLVDSGLVVPASFSSPMSSDLPLHNPFQGGSVDIAYEAMQEAMQNGQWHT